MVGGDGLVRLLGQTIHPRSFQDEKNIEVEIHYILILNEVT